jgi:hypothetical protein
MTDSIDTKSKRRLPAKLAAGIAISAFLVLGTFAVSANAEERHDGDRAGDHRDGHGGGGNWHGGGWGGGGYYGAPPVIYGAPDYYPPPVVYGPGIGIAVPGVSVGIY